MALTKRIKVGGGYYRGYVCSVASASGNYTTVIANTSGAAINGISITPDQYGALDKMKVEHMNDAAGTGSTLAILAEDIYNVGRNAAIMLDFPAAELVNNGESVKFTYINTASVAMNVYLIAEFVGIKKTA
jgi:hypothetical protein